MESLRVLAVCMVLAVATGVKVERYFDCGTPGYSGTIKSIVLEGVPTCNPDCSFYFNRTYSGHITFVSHASSQSASNKAVWDYAGTLVEFPMAQMACGNGLTCPVVKGSEVTYTVTINTPVQYFAGRFAAKWRLVGDDGRDLVCFVIPITIGPAP